MATPVHADRGSGPPDEAARAGAGVGARWAVPLGLFAMALAVRVLPWPSIFQPDGVYPHGTDAYYHLRRILYAVENFPAFLSFDPLINFPHGAQPIWSPTFDWLVAVGARALVGPGSREALERWVVWVPAVLGASTVVLVYFLGRRFFSQAVGALAGAVLCVLPAHCWYSQLGMVDHHVAVSLLSVGVLWSGMRLLAQGVPARGRDRGGLLAAGWLGLAMGAALLLWPGSLIHVAIVQVVLVARLLLEVGRRSAAIWARRLAWVHLVGLVVVAPLSAGNEWLRWGRFSPVVLSNFQPIYFAAAALVFALCSELWSRWSACEGRLARLAVAALPGTALAGLLFAGIPDLRGGVADSWAWLARDEEFQSVVAESAPLFRGPSGIDWKSPAVLLSPFLYAAPLALAGFGWREWRRRRGERALFLAWSLALLAATLTQMRFMNSYAIPHALLLAESVVALRRGLARRMASGAGAGWGLRLGMAALVLALMAPTLGAHRLHLENLLRSIRGERVLLPGTTQRLRMVADAARWLGENSPKPRGGGYSVLGPWGDGHIIEYVAERPVVQDNFGDDVAPENFALAERYFSATNEEQGLELLRQARVRYVLVRSTGSGHSQGYEAGSLFSSLYVLNGSRGQVADRSRGRRALVPALRRHRLVYESAPLADVGSGAEPFLRIFEVVPGARVVGRARAGSIVRARLQLVSRRGGPFEYRAVTRADASGRYVLRLPYSNEGKRSEVRAASRYRLEVADGSEFLVVPERAVLQGLALQGPSFE